MKTLPHHKLLLLLIFSVVSQLGWTDAKIMNPGETKGRLIFVSGSDLANNTGSAKAMNPLSIPVFEQLPAEMSVVAGTITLTPQTLVSHVQLKSRSRRTPNLDVSGLTDGIKNPIFKGFKDGDWIHMVLGKDGKILVEKSTKEDAVAFYGKRNAAPVSIRADLTAKKVFTSEDLTYKDAIRVGSKAANYAELMKALNTPDRVVVRPGYAIPFFYYQEFLDMNPSIKTAIKELLDDPAITDVGDSEYRDKELTKLQALFTAPETKVNPELVAQLQTYFDTHRKESGKLHKMRLRSSTNSEDLPNFNGAGLYESYGYNPSKTITDKTGKEKKVEKSPTERAETIKEVLKKVWGSMWTLRGFEERDYFKIKHGDVRMAIQVNLSFPDEEVNGVVVTKNIVGDTVPEVKLRGPAVYIESQRGDTFSVTNPAEGTQTEKILVFYDAKAPLDTSKYKVQVYQYSNVATDDTSAIGKVTSTATMTDGEMKDLAQQSLKAHDHFQSRLDASNKNFALDLEFKVDKEETGKRAVYFKQARPYLD